MKEIFIILIISVLGPIIGSLMGVIRKPSDTFMFNMLSFAGGVMISISFLNLIPESIALSSIPISILGIITGVVVMFALDRLIPHTNPEFSSKRESCNRLKRTSTYLIIGIFLHNFPEGMAMAIGAVSNIKVSIAIALAIAIHNIPEGICTSAPYYYCTGKRLKSFLVSSSTAIPIILGFTFAYYVFKNIPLNFVGFIIAATAGLMIYITQDELIPTSCRKLTNHATIFAFMAGVLFVILLGLI